jgi:repressor LexA
MTGTPRQMQCLAFIRTYIAARGYAPSYAEIGKELGVVNRSSVQLLVIGLEKRGLIRRIEGKWRAIEVITQS